MEIPFKIYNASAGSGKTFTLVKEYLSILLSTKNSAVVKNILAITFTNKAVNEMKTRILNKLTFFASKEIFNRNDEMAAHICRDIKMDIYELNARAERSLKFILHNYFYFDIVTIDKFNHRLLKTFAHDLKIPLNFEAGIDTKLMLEEAVDNLIDKAGENELLTKILIEFALSKADEDKDWDISRDLKQTAFLLLEENHVEHISQIKNKNLKDFITLYGLLNQLIKEQRKNIQSDASTLLSFLTSKNLDANDFTRGTLFNHFKKIASGIFNKLYENKLEENILEGNVYNKSLSPDKKAIIDVLIPEISAAYHETKKKIYQLKFFENFKKNVVPYSLLNSIHKELEEIKEEQNLILVSEFNNIISSAISNQPAPFIYERIGEKYRNYFIDEFQDTSEMQWKNLLPLISNALETETTDGKHGSLMIVGDAKQAIYRWRGGKAEQFIDLYNCNNPFKVSKKIEVLPKNYRSHDEIVKFNNSFFTHISNFLTNNRYKELYKNQSYQETNGKSGGYINFTFLENDEDQLYCETVLNHIVTLIKQGYNYKDICILTQKKKHGFLIANYLAEKDVPLVSSESLLLKNNTKVNFLINLISLKNSPNNKETILNIIKFYTTQNNIEDKHACLLKYKNNINALFELYDFNLSTFTSLPFYNAVEYAISCFNIHHTSDAYLQYFLDEILLFTQKNNSNINFLEYWENKKDSLSIVAPQDMNAVQIMTIHKSKGLEFPIVIFPFANTKIYEEINPKTWMPVNKDIFNIPYALIDKNKDLSSYNEYGLEHYNDWQAKLELDQFNVLYVALTRPVEKLFIISKREIDKKGNENTTTFSGLFINYLKAIGLYTEKQNNFEFGNKEKHLLPVTLHNMESHSIPFISNNTYNQTFKIVTKGGSLWNTKQATAIEKGNLYHYILSKIKYSSDIESAIEDCIEEGIISNEEKITVVKKIKDVVLHSELQKYFSNKNVVLNEQAILCKEGSIVKPDRIVVYNNTRTTIIDYKTGTDNPAFDNQLNMYAKHLEEMNYNIENKIIVFINDEIKIKYIL
ncbi:UvrD-helicase domain-containing protein [Abyssalbus ytuae]|uniref:DNA 3'-5' helicase n=1 Tax=Abyssalbus ytuae TaxID=2926907 RepID=A0A9E7CU23_9FLAO|nr:UvrD-helicase domain-containing protein [Abyssalbus ytuae]UOB19256.1 UvrD-helicase domain-containing protein [Abyssalbus ytuae]